MTTRERTPQEHPPVSRSPLANEPAHNTAARSAGDAFLLAADVALDRALSTEPERFLQQNRQLGGE
jgi:hypothetical protein